MKEYGLEREPILKKYSNQAAQYYARKLESLAKGKDFNQPAPPKNAKEYAERTGQTLQEAAVKTGKFIDEQNQKYHVSEKASEFADKAKQSLIGFYGKVKGGNNEQNNNQSNYSN